MATLSVFQTLSFIQRALPFRVFAMMQLLFWLALVAHDFFAWRAQLVSARTCFIDALVNCIFALSLIMVVYSQEM